jgi:hypothetical protein
MGEHDMSILTKLAQNREIYRQRPALEAENALIAEYDALRRAYRAALASHNVESALLWARRATDVAQGMVQMQGLVK